MKKKLTAGILSLAMLISLVPATTLTANAASEKDGYIFWEDFDDATTENIPVSFAVEDDYADYWTTTIEDGAIKYQLIKHDGTDDAKTLTAQKFVKMDLDIDALDMNAWYQVGFKIKYKRGGKSQITAAIEMANAQTDGSETELGSIAVDRYDALSGIAGTATSVSKTANSKGGNADEYSEATIDIKFSVLNGQTQVFNGTLGTSNAVVSYTTAQGATATDVEGTGSFKSNIYNNEKDIKYFEGLWLKVEDTNGSSHVGTGDLLSTEIIIDDVYLKQLTETAVTFDANGGYFGDDETATTYSATAYDGSVKLPEDPKKASSEFMGWYTDTTYATEFDPDNVTEETTVYAKWATAATVTFDSNGGNEVEAITTSTGTIELPTSPTQRTAMYSFVGQNPTARNLMEQM